MTTSVWAAILAMLFTIIVFTIVKIASTRKKAKQMKLALIQLKNKLESEKDLFKIIAGYSAFIAELDKTIILLSNLFFENSLNKKKDDFQYLCQANYRSTIVSIINLETSLIEYFPPKYFGLFIEINYR